jgi:hypothetical protein
MDFFSFDLTMIDHDRLMGLSGNHLDLLCALGDG